MKLALAIMTVLSTASLAQAAEFNCILENVVYKKSPVAHLESKTDEAGKITWELEILSNPRDWNRLAKAVKVTDKTDDVHAMFVAPGIKIDFYLDESDALEMGEGTIKSPKMNGDIRCTLLQQ